MGTVNPLLPQNPFCCTKKRIVTKKPLTCENRVCLAAERRIVTAISRIVGCSGAVNWGCSWRTQVHIATRIGTGVAVLGLVLATTPAVHAASPGKSHGPSNTVTLVTGDQVTT